MTKVTKPFDGFSAAMLARSIKASEEGRAAIKAELENALPAAKDGTKLLNAETRKLETNRRQLHKLELAVIDKQAEIEARENFIEAARPHVDALNDWVAKLKAEDKLQKACITAQAKTLASLEAVTTRAVKAERKPKTPENRIPPEQLVSRDKSASTKMANMAAMERRHAADLDMLMKLTAAAM